MKKFLLFCLAVCAAASVNAQEVPYSKYLNFSKSEFKENGFKYQDKTNTWYINRVSGLNETLNILAIIADAYEEIRPGSNDYRIIVQLGEDDKASCVRVIHYNNDNHFKLLSFVKKNCKDLIDMSAGKLTKYQATHGDYTIEISVEKHEISRTSGYTALPKTVKNVDESYNEYEFIIRTGVEPWSRYLEKQAEREAKRDAKGKKKRNVEQLW